jgi:predicted negative regulator of RcsB-dependent stress response
MKVFFAFLLLFSTWKALASSELPKDLRTAEEMIQDGLGRDAANRIRSWLQKNGSSPQPEAQLRLAQALLLDHRPEESLAALPKSYGPEIEPRILLVRASSLTEIGRWKEAATAWKEAKNKNSQNGAGAQAQLGLATVLLNQNEYAAATRELKDLIQQPKNPAQDSARLLLVKALISLFKSRVNHPVPLGVRFTFTR